MVAVLNGDEANNPNRRQQPALEQRDIVSGAVVDGVTQLTLAAGTTAPTSASSWWRATAAKRRPSVV